MMSRAFLQLFRETFWASCWMHPQNIIHPLLLIATRALNHDAILTSNWLLLLLLHNVQTSIMSIMYMIIVNN